MKRLCTCANGMAAHVGIRSGLACLFTIMTLGSATAKEESYSFADHVYLRIDAETVNVVGKVRRLSIPVNCSLSWCCRKTNVVRSDADG